MMHSAQGIKEDFTEEVTYNHEGDVKHIQIVNKHRENSEKQGQVV